MKKQERCDHIIEWFKENMPDVKTELNYENPFQLLIAVVLSAQCTDKRVNMITPALFINFPTPEVLAASTPEEVYQYIQSISYPHNKSKYLVRLAQLLVCNYHSEVPANLDELIKLPGVGRKTANVILAEIFKQSVMPVDTHVFRVCHRLGIVSKESTTPLSVEKELVKQIDKELLPIAHHWFLLHGRYVCVARKPKCSSCGLQSFCKYYQKEGYLIS